jgi:hypothetical protein
MAFDPAGWVNTAKLLDPVGGAADEASVRAAFGRAYYSAFQFAICRLAAIGKRPVGGENKHQWILQKLGTPKACSVASTLITLADQLSALEKARNKADYYLDDSSPFPKGAGNRIADKADIWIADFKAVSANDLKTAIR